jgi:hypothetical protein
MLVGETLQAAELLNLDEKTEKVKVVTAQKTEEVNSLREELDEKTEKGTEVTDQKI